MLGSVFEVQEELKRGVVFRGIRRASGDQVILKDVTGKDNECEIMAQLKKEGAPSKYILDFEEIYESPGGRDFLVCKYFKHGDFHSLLKTHDLNEDLIKLYTAQLIVAIEFMHQRNLVHLDIKPGNVIVDDELNLQLIDFGWSAKLRKYDDVFPWGQIYTGTEAFASPETLTAKMSWFSSDIWGIGMFSLYLATKQNPIALIHDETGYEIKDFIFNINFEIEDIPDISDSFRSFLDAVLQPVFMERLGGEKGIGELLRHEWFSDIDWDALRRKEVTPPNWILDLDNSSH